MSRDLQQRRDQQVQQKAGANVDVDSEHNPEVSRRASNAALRREQQIHSLASNGVQGSGNKLPFYDQIQASFGRHDISHIQAHTGAHAEGATRAMGAQAYATGNQIAFGGTPDLHTAAHEAAHVIQQQQGVQLKGGVGASGDHYEQNADTVADRVVQGKSAEDLLGSPSSAKAEGAAVQLKGNDKPKDADDADSASEAKTYGSVKAAIEYFAKRLHTWGPKVEAFARDEGKTEAGTGPAVQGIADIYHAAVDEAKRIKSLIAVTGMKASLARPVDTAIGAMFIFRVPMTHGASFVKKQAGMDLDVIALHRLVASFGDDIGINDLGDDHKEPKGDEKAMSKAAIESEFDALQAAIYSVDAGNPDDVKRVIQHSQYIDEVAAEHPAEMKAHRGQVRQMIADIDKLTKAHPTLAGAKNLLVKHQR